MPILQHCHDACEHLSLTSQEACSLHRLLPRVLAHMSSSERARSDGKASAIEALLRATDVMNDQDQEESGNVAALALESDAALSFAELQAKRKRLTFAAFQDANIVPRVVALDSLIGPNMAKIAKLFSRSEAISKLHWLPLEAVDAREECSTRCLGLDSGFGELTD